MSEYLWWRGLSEVDYVLATHADADHIDGLNDVLKNFSVRGALVARRPANDPEFAKFSQTLAETRTHLATIQAGDVIHFGDVQLACCGHLPVATHLPTTIRSCCECSLASVRSCSPAISKSPPRILCSDRSHNCTQTSSKCRITAARPLRPKTFVLATKPQFAIISVGRNSMFGHPHKEVVDRWQANGATVLTTGNCGTITITTNGHDLSLKTFIQPQKGTKDTKQ